MSEEVTFKENLEGHKGGVIVNSKYKALRQEKAYHILDTNGRI